MVVGGRHRVRIHAQNGRVREKVVQLLFDLLRTRADRLERPAALRAALRQRVGIAAVVAHEPPVDGVVGQRDAASRTGRRFAALHAHKASAVAAPVEKQDGLPAGENIFPQALFQRSADRSGIAVSQLLLHIDDLDRRQRLSVVALAHRIERIDAAPCEIHALDRRRRRPEHDQRALLNAAIDGDLPRMVARCIFRLIGVLLLFIDQNKAEIFRRCKHRRPRSDNDAGLAGLNSPPFVEAFSDAQ